MNESPLFWLNAFSLFYLLVTSIILIRNRFDLTPLPPASESSSQTKKISVCIPARNEEQVIGNLLESVVNQDYENLEVLVLDDRSTDKTAEIVQSFTENYPELVRLISGEEKPKKWLGKPWACQQLANRASGDYLLFLDADTTLRPGMLKRITTAFSRDSLQMVTVWPQQQLDSFWERTVIPLIYYALVTLLPAIYVYRKPRWMPAFVYNQFSSSFAAACGQCLAFTKEAYVEIGGHQTVKNDIVEDVELAKAVKSRGLTMRMYQGVSSISCRMYRSQKELFEGLRKNFLAGFGYSIPRFITAAILHVVVFVVPFFSVFYAVINTAAPLFFLSVSSLTIILLHRLILAIWFRWNPIYGFLHPIGVLWFQWLGLVKLWDHFTGKKISWKGRNV